MTHQLWENHNKSENTSPPQNNKDQKAAGYKYSKCLKNKINANLQTKLSFKLEVQVKALPEN